MFAKCILIKSFILAVSLPASAQKPHVIIDSMTRLPIEAANAVILKYSKGVSSDQNGRLKLNTATVDFNDTIAVTHINYHRRLIKLAEFNRFDTIFLVPKEYHLEEYAIQSKINLGDLKSKYVLGFFSSKRSIGWSEFGFRTGFQIGVKMENSNGIKGILSQIRLHFESIPQGVKFRVRIMKINEDGSLGNDILKDGIVITPRNRRPKIDIKEYRILLPANGVFVCVDHLGDGKTYPTRLDEPAAAIKLTSASRQLTFHGYRETPWILFPFKTKGLYSNAQIELTVLAKK